MTKKPDIKQSINSRLGALTTEGNLAQTVTLAQAQQPKRRLRRRIFVVAIALCICLFATGALAVTVPDFRRFLGNVTPDIIQMFQPIELSAQDNGIKMEVLAAINDDEMAAVYLTLQDFEGDRVDEHIDLYNFTIRGTHMMTSELVDYDEETKTAIIRMVGNGGKKLNGKKTTVSVQIGRAHV